MSSNQKKLFMVFFYRLSYCIFVKVIIEGSCFKLKKLVFEVKHSLNTRIFVEGSFENLHCTNVSKLI
jgi:hypothetical protein